jgi:hypothetical protein
MFGLISRYLFSKIAAGLLLLVAAFGLFVYWNNNTSIRWYGGGLADFCDDRVARTFDRFWRSVDARQLDERERYTISARHGGPRSMVRVALTNCQAEAGAVSPPKQLTCIVQRTIGEANLVKGDPYRLDVSDVINWTYHRGFKSHHGCDLSKRLSFTRGSRSCDQTARRTFPDFAWAIATKNVGPLDHWIDIRLPNDADPYRLGEQLEVRLNRCRRKEDFTLVCRVDSAPPEVGYKNDSERVVTADETVNWSYKLGERRIHSCDGVDLSAERKLHNKLREWKLDAHERLAKPQ